MRKVLLLFICLSFTLLSFCETIQLKNGKTIDAPILDKTDEYIKVDIGGVGIRYYIDEVESVDGSLISFNTKQVASTQATANDIDIEHIRRILKKMQYPEHTWPEIEKELIDFLVKINFLELKQKVLSARYDSGELKNVITEIGKRFKSQGYPNIDTPSNLAKILVDSLDKEDVLGLVEGFPADESLRGSYLIFACPAVSQLTSIVLSMMDLDVKVALSPDHVFNFILLEDNLFLFIDNTNQIFEIIDMGHYYDVEGSSYVLKASKRMSFIRKLEIRKKWQEGIVPDDLVQILNRLYSYVYTANNYSASHCIYNSYGVLYGALGYSNKAIGKYKQALRTDPKSFEAYLGIGIEYSKNGDNSQAIKNYEQALAINPNDCEIYHHYGEVYYMEKNFEEAVKYYSYALERDPLYIKSYIALGNAYADQGNYGLAVETYSQGLKIGTYGGALYYNRATANYLQGNYDRSWEDVRMAQASGLNVDLNFLQMLRAASGRNK